MPVLFWFLAIGTAPVLAAPPDALPEGARARLGTTRLRHGGSVISVAFSPDSTKVASVGNDKLIRLWDAVTGKELRQLTGHQGGVESVAFSPDGKSLLTASYDQTLRLWDVATGKEIRQFSGHTGAVLPVAMAPDGKTAASEGRDSTVRIWDVATGQELRRLPGHSSSGTSNLAFAPNGRLLAAVTDGGTIVLWNAATGLEVRRLAGHEGDVHSVDFSPDGKYLASAGADTTVRLWEVAAGREVRRCVGHQQLAASVRFAPDGKTVASASADFTIRLWDAATAREVRRFIGHQDIVSEISFAPDGKTLASAGHDHTVRLWDVATGEELPQSGGLADCAALAPDGRVLATGSQSRSVRFWDVATGKPLPRVLKQDAGVLALAYSANGKRLVTAGDDLKLRLWDLAGAREVRQLEGHRDRVSALAFTPDDRTLVSAGQDRAVLFWDLATGAERGKGLTELQGDSYRGRVEELAVSPDGKLVATAGDDKGLRLWDLATGAQVRVPGAPAHSVTFSADGKTLFATASSAAPGLWETVSGEERVRWQGETPGVVGAIAPDGRLVAWGDEEGSIHFGDAATGKSLAQRTGHEQAVTFLAFTADGKTLVSAGGDSTALLWDLATVTKQLETRSVRLSGAELEEAWAGLGGVSGRRAHQAIWALIGTPEQAVGLVRARLQPAPPGGPEQQIDRLIADLDHDDYAVREKATRDLQRMGRLAELSLRQAAATASSVEVRRRAESVLEKLRSGVLPPEVLRPGRAVEVLERLGTAEGRQVLEELSRGDPDAPLTRDARAALARLSRK
jgi:WD40 repeat protein